MTNRTARLVPLLTTLCLPACIIDLSGDLGETIEGHLESACIGASTRSEHVTIDEPIHAVVIDSGVGDITVRPHDQPGAHIEAELFGDEPGEPWMRVEDGVLHVGVDCTGCCGADLQLTVPAAAELTVDLGVGDVDVTGLSGPARVHTGTGDIELHQLGGPLDLEAGTGAIEGDGLAGAEVAAEVGTGDVTLAFDSLAPLRTVGVDVGVGAVELRVPTGGYALDLHSGVGSVDVDDLQHEAGAEPRISVEVGTGAIDVRGM